MSNSSLLRLQDIRRAYRLIGECRDLASTPELWQQRVFDGLLVLLGGDRASGGEGVWRRPTRPLAVLSAYWSGFDDRTLTYVVAYIYYLRATGAASDPIITAFLDLPGTHNTRARRELIGDREWYRSVAFNEFQRPAGCDKFLMSSVRTSTVGALTCMTVYRPDRAREFSTRERQLMHFFCGELGPLIGRSLVSVTDPRPEHLAPRLRQTLHFLLQGDSEKQVAARLGLSPSTTHEYITALYRRFGVHSRAELMAYAIKRLPQRALKTLQQNTDVSDDDR